MGSSAYAAKASTLMMDQICLVAQDKTLSFYEMQGAKFEEMKMAREITLEELPTQIFWDGDNIYLANKKHYLIMDKD